MNIDKKDIRIINRYSDLSEKQVDKILKAHVYNSPESWQKFLRLLFISLGIAFTTAGILFFFAYNWADLHKFIKLGLVEGLIITLTSVVLFSNIKIDIKHIIITGTAILVGVLFAVFGQIYQTGANAYDFFLGWTIFITLWVVVLNFPPLWLVFITLVNTTLILYSEQVAHGWSAILLSTLLFSINLLFLVAFIITSKTVETIKTPNWFLNIIALATIVFSTIGISISIFEPYELATLVLVSLSVIIYAIGIIYGLRAKRGFYLSIIPFSVIVICSAFFIKISVDPGMFFIISLFIVISVTLVIRNLINLQKKWTNE
jgi:uncharacterized membrane protein